MNLINKKIGIWGLGIVGSSVLKYVQNLTPHIQILDQKPNEALSVIVQTPHNIESFLDHNDFIFPSPGIPLLNYQTYQHKFVHELDIFSSQCTNKVIAITGTLGKTTITSFIEQCIASSIAAGNIGYAMLDVLSLQPQPSTIVLELSSYQLQYTKTFAPSIAIWTNFYPNHLDHHATIDEYFAAKCNIFKYQNSTQKALIPADLIDAIEATIKIESQMYLFSTSKPKITKYPTFYIDQNDMVLSTNNQTIKIFKRVDQLPDTTFLQNWIAILAALYLNNIETQTLSDKLYTLQPPQHRVEFVKKINGVSVYNDSKSTVWQATQCAIQRFPYQRIALFLGGLSKGTDRTPLIEYISTQNITVFAFGAQAEILSTLCKNYNVPHLQAETLQQALDLFLQQHQNFDILLFSPAGSSFDLFKNFEDRGTQFKKMIHDIKGSKLCSFNKN